MPTRRSDLFVPKSHSLRILLCEQELFSKICWHSTHNRTSAHPLQSGPAIDDVFFLTDSSLPSSNRTILVNLHGSFADNHPSGIEVEQLTLLSIIGTLHSAFPEFTEVKFLADGQNRATLSGHASLDRGYPLVDTSGRLHRAYRGSDTTMKTIGVFDSGFGGLTVLRELLPLIPDASYIYLGDTARLPYGSKSRATIARYAVSSAKFLADQGADLLVVACNTATALALDEIRAASPIPIVGVVEPGAQACLRAAEQSSAGVGRSHILVLATTATTQSRAYSRTLAALNLKATEKACPLRYHSWRRVGSNKACIQQSPSRFCVFIFWKLWNRPQMGTSFFLAAHITLCYGRSLK